mmetsp:Transcript_29468/g.61408  ORF Transcript_29468/g.61408 Transcript_29468/m.61408 type:complete len:499 (-) Transcript_29468:235-1731(-)
MRHRHSIRTVKVDVSKHAVDSFEFVLDLLGVFGVLEVQVTRKELVRSLTGENHLDVRSSTFCQEPVRDGTSDKFGLVGFHVIDDLWDEIENLVGRKCTNAVRNGLVSAEFVHHGTSCHDIGRVFHAHGKGWDGTIVSEFFAFPLVQRKEVVADDARVNTTGEEESVIDVRHHSLLNGLREGVTDFFVRNRVGFVFPRGVVFVAEPFGVVVANQAFLGSPVVARRNCNHGIGVGVSDQRFEFAREDVCSGFIASFGGALGASVVQRLDSNGVACGKRTNLPGLDVFFEDDESKHTIEHSSGLWTTVFGNGVRNNLAIRSGHALVVPAVLVDHALIKFFVVVNFSVRREVDDFFGSLCTRSEFQVEGHVGESVRRIDDGQAGVAHRPACVVGRIRLPTDGAGADLVAVGTTVIQDSCRLAECFAIVENRDRGTRCSGGSDRPDIIDGSHETAHLAALRSRRGDGSRWLGGGSCQRASRKPLELAAFTYEISNPEHVVVAV